MQLIFCCSCCYTRLTTRLYLKLLSSLDLILHRIDYKMHLLVFTGAHEPIKILFLHVCDLIPQTHEQVFMQVVQIDKGNSNKHVIINTPTNFIDLLWKSKYLLIKHLSAKKESVLSVTVKSCLGSHLFRNTETFRI